MTTERVTRDSGMAVLAGAALVTAAMGAVLALVGGIVAGPSAAWGAVIGTGLALVVFGLGAASVNVVASELPTMSLIVAIMTYLLQLVLLWLVLSALESSELLESTLDRQWLGGAVILGAMAWMAGQVRLHLTRRVPVFDLPEAGPGTGPEDSPEDSTVDPGLAKADGGTR